MPTGWHPGDRSAADRATITVSVVAATSIVATGVVPGPVVRPAPVRVVLAIVVTRNDWHGDRFAEDTRNRLCALGLDGDIGPGRVRVGQSRRERVQQGGQLRAERVGVDPARNRLGRRERDLAVDGFDGVHQIGRLFGHRGVRDVEGGVERRRPVGREADAPTEAAPGAAGVVPGQPAVGTGRLGSEQVVDRVTDLVVAVQDGETPVDAGRHVEQPILSGIRPGFERVRRRDVVSLAARVRRMGEILCVGRSCRLDEFPEAPRQFEQVRHRNRLRREGLGQFEFDLGVGRHGGRRGSVPEQFVADPLFQFRLSRLAVGPEQQQHVEGAEIEVGERDAGLVGLLGLDLGPVVGRRLRPAVGRQTLDIAVLGQQLPDPGRQCGLGLRPRGHVTLDGRRPEQQTLTVCQAGLAARRPRDGRVRQRVAVGQRRHRAAGALVVPLAELVDALGGEEVAGSVDVVGQCRDNIVDRGVVGVAVVFRWQFLTVLEGVVVPVLDEFAAVDHVPFREFLLALGLALDLALVGALQFADLRGEHRPEDVCVLHHVRVGLQGRLSEATLEAISQQFRQRLAASDPADESQARPDAIRREVDRQDVLALVGLVGLVAAPEDRRRRGVLFGRAVDVLEMVATFDIRREILDEAVAPDVQPRIGLDAWRERRRIGQLVPRRDLAGLLECGEVDRPTAPGPVAGLLATRPSTCTDVEVRVEAVEPAVRAGVVAVGDSVRELDVHVRNRRGIELSLGGLLAGAGIGITAVGSADIDVRNVSVDVRRDAGPGRITGINRRATGIGPAAARERDVRQQPRVERGTRRVAAAAAPLLVIEAPLGVVAPLGLPEFEQILGRQRGPPRVQAVVRQVERLPRQRRQFGWIATAEIRQAVGVLADPRIDRRRRGVVKRCVLQGVDIVVAIVGRRRPVLGVVFDCGLHAPDIGMRTERARCFVTQRRQRPDVARIVVRGIRPGSWEVVVRQAESPTGRDVLLERPVLQQEPEERAQDAGVVVFGLVFGQLEEFRPAREVRAGVRDEFVDELVRIVCLLQGVDDRLALFGIGHAAPAVDILEGVGVQVDVLGFDGLDMGELFDIRERRVQQDVDKLPDIGVDHLVGFDRPLPIERQHVVVEGVSPTAVDRRVRLHLLPGDVVHPEVADPRVQIGPAPAHVRDEIADRRAAAVDGPDQVVDPVGVIDRLCGEGHRLLADVRRQSLPFECVEQPAFIGFARERQVHRRITPVLAQSGQPAREVAGELVVDRQRPNDRDPRRDTAVWLVGSSGAGRTVTACVSIGLPGQFRHGRVETERVEVTFCLVGIFEDRRGVLEPLHGGVCDVLDASLALDDVLGELVDVDARDFEFD